MRFFGRCVKKDIKIIVKVVINTNMSLSVPVFRIKNFDPSIFSYSAVQTNQYGGKAVYVNTSDRKGVHLQAPKMKGSIQKFVPKDKAGQQTGPTKYSLRLSFGYEPTGMVEKYRTILREWDAKMIQMGQDNCVDWFKKKAGTLDADVVTDMYSPMLGISIDSDTLEEDGKYPDSTRCKLQVNEDGTFDAKDLTIYDEDQNEILNVNDIPNGSYIIPIIKCGGVWFAAGKFGISWKVVQMQVFRPQRITGFSILPDLEPEYVEDNSNHQDVEPPASPMMTATVTTKAILAESEDESVEEPKPDEVKTEAEPQVEEGGDEEDESSEPEPVVESPKKKKNTKTTKPAATKAKPAKAGKNLLDGF
jgi:hypothetical protein